MTSTIVSQMYNIITKNENKYNISNTFFYNIYNTYSAGGAICIVSLSSCVNITEVFFDNCHTTQNQQTQSKRMSSGGSALIDARQVNVLKTSFLNCAGPGYGGSFCAVGSRSEIGSYELCSDHLGSGTNAVILDLMQEHVNNANLSHPTSTYDGGSFHIGNNPSDTSVKYLTVSQAVWGFGISCISSTYKEVHHIGFSNCTGRGALFITFNIDARVTNLQTFGCSGTLWYASVGGKLTLIDSWVSGVDTKGVSFEGSRRKEDRFLTLPLRVLHQRSYCSVRGQALLGINNVLSFINFVLC